MLTVYGIKVRAYDYEQVKRLADTLFGYTSTALNEQESRIRCVHIAMRAIEEAKVVSA